MGFVFLSHTEADLLARDRLGGTPLHIAAQHSHLEVVKALVEASMSKPKGKSQRKNCKIKFCKKRVAEFFNIQKEPALLATLRRHVPLKEWSKEVICYVLSF